MAKVKYNNMKNFLNSGIYKKLIIFSFFAAIFFYCYFITHYSSRILQSHHGLYHSSYIYQLYNGIIPPTNPLVAEAPANIYWPWHLLVAVIMHAIKKSPLEVVSLLNCLALAASAVILFKYSREKLSLSFSASLIVALLPFVILKSFYALYFLFQNLIFTNLPKFESFYTMITGIKPDKNSISFIEKFYSQSSFPTVMALFYIAIYLNSKLQMHTKYIYRIVEFVIFSLLGLFNPIALFVFDFWIFSIELPALKAKNFFLSLRKLFQKYAALVFVNVFVFVYIYFLSKHIGGQTELKVDINDSLILSGNIMMVIIILLLIPFFFRKKFDSDILLTSLFRFMLFMLVIVNVVTLPARNEYKMILLSAAPFTFLLAGILKKLLGEKVFIKRGVKIFSAVFLIFMFVFCAYEKVNSTQAEADPWCFEGVNIRINSNATRKELGKISNYVHTQNLGDLQDACDWLRTNTSAKAYIITIPLRRDDLFLPVLTQRRVFVARPSLQTEKVKNFNLIYRLNTWFLKRIKKTGQFYIKKDEQQYSHLLGITKDLEHLYALVGKRSQKVDSAPATVVYENNSSTIHKLEIR